MLLDHFKVLPRDIALLTDWQIDRLYWHHRTKEGEIKPPEDARTDPLAVTGGDGTLEDELRSLEVIGAALHLPEEQLKTARQKLCEKWETKADGSPLDNPG